MTDAELRIVTMVLYMAICLALGVIAFRRTRTLGDYAHCIPMQ